MDMECKRINKVLYRIQQHEQHTRVYRWEIRFQRRTSQRSRSKRHGHNQAKSGSRFQHSEKYNRSNGEEYINTDYYYKA